MKRPSGIQKQVRRKGTVLASGWRNTELSGKHFTAIQTYTVGWVLIRLKRELYTEMAMKHIENPALIKSANDYKDDDFILLSANGDGNTNDGKYWHVTNSADTCVIWCAGFCQSNEDGKLALRVAAALNYCKDLSTEHLLSVGV